MAQDILLQRKGGVLAPYDAYAAEQVEGLTSAPVMAKVSVPRSISQHRWFWAELGTIVKATECAPSSRHLNQALKIALGYTMPVFDAKGEIVSLIPDSIAFDAMPQHEFNTYTNAVQKLVAERWGYVMTVKPASQDMEGAA